MAKVMAEVEVKNGSKTQPGLKCGKKISRFKLVRIESLKTFSLFFDDKS